MPRPFPLPINIGTDICSVKRILAITNTPTFERFARRILTPAEWSLHQEKLIRPARAYKDLLALRKSKPEKHSPHRAIEDAAHKAASFLAGRFAAKEAVMKANQCRRLTYHDIEIVAITKPSSHSSGSLPPIAIIRSKSGSWENGQEVPISISHDGDYATATSLAFSTLDPDHDLRPNVSPSQLYSVNPPTEGATTLPERSEVEETQVQGELGPTDERVIEVEDFKGNALGNELETEEHVGNETKDSTTES